MSISKMIQTKYKYFLLSFICLCYVSRGVVSANSVNDNGAGDAEDQGVQDNPQGQPNAFEEQGTHINFAHEQIHSNYNRLKNNAARADTNGNEYKKKYKSQHDESQSKHASPQSKNKPHTNSPSHDKHNTDVDNEVNFESQNQLDIKKTLDNEMNSENDEIENEDKYHTNTLFTESGPSDENLIDQIKRLGEKIHKEVAEKQIDQLKSTEENLLVQKDLNKIRNKKQRSRMEKALKENHLKNSEGLDNFNEDAIGSFDRMTNHPSRHDTGMKVESKGNLVDHFKDSEKSIKIPDDLGKDEDGLFPPESSFTQDDTSSDFSSSAIENTKPPSDIQPSKTQTLAISQQSVVNNVGLDKVVVREMSTADHLKPSTVDSLYQTQLPNSKVEQNDKHNTHSNFAKKNRRIKNYKESKAKYQIRDTLQDSEASTGVLDRSLDDSSLEIIHIKETYELETSSTQNQYVKHTITNMDNGGKEAHYSGTIDDNFKSVTIQQSSVQSAGDMKKTEVRHIQAKHLPKDINSQVDKSDNDQHYPRSTQTPYGEKGNKITGVCTYM